MELWIRSQDRTTLIKANRVDARANSIIVWEGYTDIYLGNYKTKERALEVLDEIHQRLINLQCIEITGADFISQQMKRNGVDCVYEMPKE